MTNNEKYIKAFAQTFMIQENTLNALKYQDIPAWDSVGHMALMAELEDVFSIELEIDDIIDFSSFEKGKSILSKYDILIN
jgi:acyl carrier protein